MRTFAHSKILPTAAWPVLVILMVTLTACHPDFATKTSATPGPSPTQPAPAASATAEQPTSPPQPTLTLAPQAPGVPQMLRETAITYPNRLIWSGDGQRLGVFAEGGFTLFNAETLEILATRELQSPAYALDFSPDGKTFAFTPDGQSIQLEDLDQGQMLRTIQPGSTFQRAIFSPDGRWLAVDSMEQWAYALWEVASGQPGAVLTGFETAAPVYAADFSASGNKLIWHARGTIQVMDIVSGTLGPVMGHEDFISAFALSPDDATLATAAGGTLNGEFAALINIWNPQSGERVAAYPQARSASAMTYSPDGAVLAVAVGGDVLMLDPATGQSLRTFNATGDAITSLGFSPDGSRLATTGSDGTLRVWSLR